MTEYEAGRELDALIAERVMGWESITIEYWDDKIVGRQLELAEWLDDVDIYMIGDYFINVPTDFWIAQKNWKPSTDISAAWAVVEKIKENPYLYPQIIWSHSWVCKIWRNNPNDNEDFGWLAEVYAPTAPEAICRAALAAVGE